MLSSRSATCCDWHTADRCWFGVAALIVDLQQDALVIEHEVGNNSRSAASQQPKKRCPIQRQTVRRAPRYRSGAADKAVAERNLLYRQPRRLEGAPRHDLRDAPLGRTSSSPPAHRHASARLGDADFVR
jgi:hypothetical protein